MCSKILGNISFVNGPPQALVAPAPTITAGGLGVVLAVPAEAMAAALLPAISTELPSLLSLSASYEPTLSLSASQESSIALSASYEPTLSLSASQESSIALSASYEPQLDLEASYG